MSALDATDDASSFEILFFSDARPTEQLKDCMLRAAPLENRGHARQTKQAWTTPPPALRPFNSTTLLHQLVSGVAVVNERKYHHMIPTHVAGHYLHVLIV